MVVVYIPSALLFPELGCCLGINSVHESVLPTPMEKIPTPHTDALIECVKLQ
jgi:hypothetical protein